MKKYVFAALLLYALPLMAQTYEWTDEQGTVNFTEDLGKVPKKYRKKVKVLGGDVPPAQVQELQEKAPDGAPAKVPEKGGEPMGASFGGKEEKWWREQFGTVTADLKAGEKDLVLLRQRFSDTAGMSRSEYLTLQSSLKHGEYRVLELRKRLQSLNDQADRAGVPTELRE